jgi:mono/diheme cytochrome c family protein
MRRWAIVIAVLIVAVALAAAGFFFWPAPLPNVADARSKLGPDSAKRGEYLVRAADCAACHTLGSGKPFAGGLPFMLPFGTIYATNITPDKETGIGLWSDAEFVRALHSGVSRDGKDLYPAFPYTSYARMTTEDALAIKDYLFTVEPVHAAAPQSKLDFPYNQRFLMRAWKLLFLSSRPAGDDPKLKPDQNRGAYLVEALGHCGECHTARNKMFALDQAKKFGGAVTAGWKAYNISSDKEQGIGAWTDDQLADYLSKGHGKGRGSASGSMAEAVEFSLRFLNEPDLRAMVSYLRTVPPQSESKEGVVATDPVPVKASTLLTPGGEGGDSLGMTMFESACASCHAWNGEGVQHPQAALLGSQTVNDPEGTNLIQVLLQGSHIQTEEGDAFMPRFGSAYTDEELAALSNFVIAHFGAKQSHITAQQVSNARNPH